MNVLMTAAIDPDPTIADPDRLGDEIAELSAHLEAATARLLDLIREFDARAGWNHGFRSCAHWLSWRVGLDLGAAREKVRVARSLGGLPRLAKALAHGELSYAKVRALTRVATPATEERLLAVGRAGTAEHVERIVRGWRRVDQKAEARESATRHRSRALHAYRNDDGMVTVRGRLEPEAGELFDPSTERRARGTLSAHVSGARRCRLDGRFRGNACVRAAAGRCPGAARGGRPPSRYRSGSSGRAVSGRRSCRRSCARRSRGAGAVGSREWRTRFRGNVATPGMRCQPRRHAARPRRPRRGSRGANADDSAGSTPHAAPSRPRLPISRL